MPEGPEVRRAADLIKDTIGGQRLTGLTLISGKLHRQGLNADVQVPSEPVNVHVKGKSIFIQAGDQVIHSTLGMAGWWYPDPETMRPDLATRMVYDRKRQPVTVSEAVTKMVKSYGRVKLTGETASVYYVDARNFGNMKVLTKEEAMQRWRELGIDLLVAPLIEPVAIEFRAKTKPTLMIGEALLNQDVVSGIGNIYRAEGLYAAKISPFRKVSEVSDAELVELFSQTREIMRESYRLDGQVPFKVYGSGESADLGGRTIWWNSKEQS